MTCFSFRTVGKITYKIIFQLIKITVLKVSRPYGYLLRTFTEFCSVLKHVGDMFFVFCIVDFFFCNLYF